MKKRLLCTMLILFLCITSFIPLTAYADYTSGVWEYTYYEDGVRITAYNGSASSVTIPNTIDGRPVLAIGTGVFEDQYQLVTVSIPSSVERIQQNAFRNCKKLTSVTLPQELEYLGSHAFAECEQLSKVTVNSENITEVVGSAFSDSGTESATGIAVTFTSTVEKIPKNLFTPANSQDYPRIVSVTIGANVEEIGNYAFRYCADLETVTIASGSELEIIRTGAFQECNRLASINLPDSVERIEQNAFRNCKYLTSITLPQELEYLGSHAFAECERLSKITVNSEYITEVIGSAFSESGIESDNGIAVTFSSTVEKISKNLFTPASSNNYPRIKSVTIGKNVTEIGNYTFRYCEDLETVTFASGCKLETIGSSAFSGCESIRTITFPEKLSAIKSSAFSGCESLTQIKFTGNAPTFGSDCFKNVEATVYYPKGDSTWTSDKMKDYSGTLTWKAFSSLNAPTLKVSNVASTGKIKLTWSKVDGAAKYQVYRATSKSGTYSLLKTTTGTTLTNTSTTTGKTYYYKVRAVDASGNKSEFSSIVSRTCDLPQPKVTVSNVASSGKIKITWEKVDGATKYQVYRATSKDGTYSLLKTVTGTSLTNTSVEVGKTYYYKVKAIHSTSAANSAYSSVVSRTCDLARPTAKVALNSKGKPVISWGKVEGAVKYTLYIYDANGNLLKTSSTTGLKMTHSSAVKGTTYKYRVVAVHSNSAANSAKSSTVSITSK